MAEKAPIFAGECRAIGQIRVVISILNHFTVLLCYVLMMLLMLVSFLKSSKEDVITRILMNM